MKPLRDFNAAERLWAAGFLGLAGLGLLVAVAQVHLDSGLALEGLKARFAGPETDAIATHSFASLLQSTHTHVFTLAFLQLALGAFFLASSASPAWKKSLAGGAFLLILCDQASMWMVHLAGPAWVPALWISGSLMMLAMGLEIGCCLKELCFG